MIIVVAGMPRSGSTLSYNIARELLSSRGELELVLSNSLSLPNEFLAGQSKNLLLKSHAPDRAVTDLVLSGNALCICTIRKPEDAIASWMEIFDFSLEESLMHFEAWMKWHRCISEKSLDIYFDEIEKDLVSTVKKISNFLFGEVLFDEIISLSKKYQKDEVYRRSNELNISSGEEVIDCGFSFYDRDTLFHRRHVSSLVPRTAEDILSAEQIRKIRLHLNCYLDSVGNYQRGYD